MQIDYTKGQTRPKGIREANRARLSLLHTRLQGPFSPAQAAQVLDLDIRPTRRLLAHLTEHGWLARVRPGLYITVPLEAPRPSEWQGDPWVVATRAFDPCYIGGWSACEHWGLTEQIFRDIVVISARPARRRIRLIQGTRYRVKTLSAAMLFGTQPVWRGEVRVQVSDPSRTLVDILDDPSIGGGINQVSLVLESYLASDMRDEQTLLSYVSRRGNRTVYKRLGYLIEALSLDAADLAEACRSRISSGFTVLDPTVRVRGRLSKRWNLWVNIAVHPAGRS
jgi:predicted transcriptional regulator of viral defense system